MDNYSETLSQLVLTESRPVTFGWLSKNSCIDSSTSIDALEQFFKENSPKVDALYSLMGLAETDGQMGYKIKLVEANKVEETKNQFKHLDKCHIYCVHVETEDRKTLSKKIGEESIKQMKLLAASNSEEFRTNAYGGYHTSGQYKKAYVNVIQKKDKPMKQNKRKRKVSKSTEPSSSKPVVAKNDITSASKTPAAPSTITKSSSKSSKKQSQTTLNFQTSKKASTSVPASKTNTPRKVKPKKKSSKDMMASFLSGKGAKNRKTVNNSLIQNSVPKPASLSSKPIVEATKSAIPENDIDFGESSDEEQLCQQRDEEDEYEEEQKRFEEQERIKKEQREREEQEEMARIEKEKEKNEKKKKHQQQQQKQKQLEKSEEEPEEDMDISSNANDQAEEEQEQEQEIVGIESDEDDIEIVERPTPSRKRQRAADAKVASPLKRKKKTARRERISSNQQEYFKNEVEESMVFNPVTEEEIQNEIDEQERLRKLADEEAAIEKTKPQNKYMRQMLEGDSKSKLVDDIIVYKEIEEATHDFVDGSMTTYFLKKKVIDEEATEMARSEFLKNKPHNAPLSSPKPKSSPTKSKKVEIKKKSTKAAPKKATKKTTKSKKPVKKAKKAPGAGIMAFFKKK
eukprot:TRINITY_DN169104_c0_g1_i1.p1 TRINITY_DN169104_c0_g1~~TRINITY_DN169104_c0_g1_i1.p1  ORF type:complete len:627 (-),score=249.47 TRINITY_DN169104_c0_g1_i1:146-2026(-)